MQTQTVVLNVAPGGVPPIVYATQNDNGRTVHISVIDGASGYSLSDSYTYVICGTKPSGTGFSYDDKVTKIGSSMLSFDVNTVMTAVAGPVRCGIIIYDGDQHVETLNFILHVQRAALPSDVIIDSDDFSSIIDDAIINFLDENADDIIYDWLDEHPEAVVAIADGSITEAKFTDDLKLKTINEYSTPEMYGAKGDGTTDDTTAIQSAVDSGLNVIFSKGKTYKTGTITVDRDCVIDCSGATFLCTGSVLFDCQGSVASQTAEADYTAGQVAYSLSSDFTGVVHLKGTNNVFKQRSYYMGGSVEMFEAGVMTTVIPIDITNVTAYRLSTIKVDICNIGDVSFTTSAGSAVVIKQTYCAFSVVENVNVSNLCYSVVQLNQCFSCSIKDSSFDIPQNGSLGTNYYPIEILDTCYTTVENIQGHCVGWHCIATGGHTLCRKTTVFNCRLFSDYGVPAYDDHENGIETILDGCVVSSAMVGLLSVIRNCDIVCNTLGTPVCRVDLHCSSVQGLAVYSIEKCRFYPNHTSYSGIRNYVSPQSAGYGYDYYFDSVTISDCVSLNSAVNYRVLNGKSNNVTGTVTVGAVTIMNSNVSNLLTAQEINLFPEKIDNLYTDYLRRTGKNYLRNTANSLTANGLTFTVNSDGTVVVNGTATADTTFVINTGVQLAEGQYVISGCPEGGTTNTYMIGIQGFSYDIGNGQTISIPANDISRRVFILIRSGVTIDNLTFSPMIRDANLYDATYEPYTPTVNELYTMSIPSGGTAGQFLVKSSAADYDMGWVTVPNASEVAM